MIISTSKAANNIESQINYQLTQYPSFTNEFDNDEHYYLGVLYLTKSEMLFLQDIISRKNYPSYIEKE